MDDNRLECLVKHISFSDKSLPFGNAIYSGIKTAIVNGECPLGFKIVEKQLAECLNISRTPVRNALKKLEGEGFVDYVRNSGFTVNGLNYESIKEIYLLREALETIVLLENMNRMTESDFREIEVVLQAVRQALSQKNYDHVNALFSDFNDRIFGASGMMRIMNVIDHIKGYRKLIKQISFANSQRIETAIEEHEQMVQLLRAKDVPGLKALHKAHLEKSRLNVLASLSESIR